MSLVKAAISEDVIARSESSRILSESDLVRLKGTCLPAASSQQRTLLEKIEAMAVLVAPAEIPPDVVTMNTTIECMRIGGIDVHEWTLVYPDEAHYQQGRISVLSPAGIALFGARCGQTVSFRPPSGVLFRYLIRRILSQPESCHLTNGLSYLVPPLKNELF